MTAARRGPFRRLLAVLTLLSAVFAGPHRADATGCASCPKASLGPALRLYDSIQVNALVIDDFNGDGLPDVAVAGYNNGTPGIGIHLGTPSGELAPLTFFPLPSVPPAFSMASGDFDHDGNVDLVFVSSAPNSLYLMRGTGSGSFLPPEQVPAFPSITAVAAADIDGDGNLDIVATSFDRLVVLSGDGSGGFTQAISLPVGPGASAPGVADLNGDGLPDIFVANRGADSVSVVLNVAMGPFAPPRVFTVGSSPARAVAGDFDGDGRMDLAVANAGHGITVLLGGAADLFQPPIYQSLPNPFPQPSELVAGHFDLDSNLDLAVLDGFNGPATLSVLHGDGTGLFPRSESASNLFVSLAVGDFNRDGVGDLVSGASTRLALLESAPDIGLALPVAVFNPGQGGRGTAADFNGDGHTDVVVGSFSGFFFYPGNASGGFDPPIRGQAADNFVAAADMNGDGRPDLLWYGGDSLRVELGNGDGTFGPPLYQAVGLDAVAAAIADLDGDGIPDVVVANRGGNSISILLGAGNGTFKSRQDVAVGAGPNAVALGDFNGDGKLDVVVSNGGADNVAVLLGDGHGGFSSIQLITVGASPTSVVAADFDGDHKVDLAVLKTQFPNSGLRVLFGDGSGGFPAFSETPLSFASSNSSMQAADFNGDGRPDLVILGMTNVGPTLVMNDGSGGFLPPAHFLGESSPLSMVIADFGGDARPGLVLFHYSQSFVVLRNTNCVPRRLGLTADISACATPGVPFSSQPTASVFDDGGNVVVCDAGPVTASIAPGSGTSGASLGGTKTVAAVAGAAAFTNLSVDLAGRGYRLAFSHPAGPITHSRVFSVGLSVSIAGPSQYCAASQGRYDAGPGFDAYEWSVDAVVVSHGRTVTLTGLPAGPHTVSVTATKDGCAVSNSKPVTVLAVPSGVVTSTSAVCPYASGVAASVPDAGPGATYAWTIGNGVILTGAGTSSITFKAGPSGQVTLSVTVTNAVGCSASGTKTVGIDGTLSCPGPVGFFTVAPCRVLDTRSPAGPYGGPALTAHGERVFVVSGQCGIPADATAVSINVVAVGPTDGPGFLTVYPAGTVRTSISTINYKVGQARANNGIVGLGAAGDLAIYCGQGTGTADVVLDVNGYFR